MGTINLLSDDELQKIINDLWQQIFKDKSIASVSDKMLNYFVDQLWKAVTKGYGADLTEVDFDTPDHDMLQALKADVIKFSAAKDHAMNIAIRNELSDASGHLRSFDDFKKAAKLITDDHTQTWLKAEYNFAVSSAQMSSKWKQITEEQEDIPLLQYETVGDDRVRPAHRELDGVTRGVNDWFWDTYYPPNGWNCRCTVRRLADGTVTPDAEIITPDNMPSMFKINFGKQKIVFPPGHPYYKT